MGLPHSCPFAEYSDLEKSLESVTIKSIIGDDEDKTPKSSITFKGEEPKVLTASNSGRMLVERSVSFRTDEYELSDFKKASSEARSNSLNKKHPSSLVLDPNNPKNEAAIKLQKVYKSFRTRRKLADCAVLVEQSWWKLLDFAELKHSSISFFEVDKHETAMSRWSRARTRAAKVGKGLSKNGKARKLALQHWLEAIDPRHRYGHNLHFYYVKWLHSQSKQPFFYWLDIGEGKEINLVEKCSRLKLQQQCIKYLGPMERKAYEVVLEDGKFFNAQTGELIDTTGEPKGAKWIFVLSTSKILYIGMKKKGTFQHSSFLAGGATLAAGRIVAENGILKAVWPHSGHYRPTPENFQDLVSFLRENDVDLADVKLDSVDDEEESVHKKDGVHVRNHSSEDDLTEEFAEEKNIKDSALEKEEKGCLTLEESKSEALQGFARKLSDLEIPSKGDILERLKSENQECEINGDELFPMEEKEDLQDHDLSDEELELDEGNKEIISEECILKRINSHKETKSYQLGKHLSFKWTTGAGPRIGCVRDYPSGLQSHALEQVNLSPKRSQSLRLELSFRGSTPTSCSAPSEKGNLFHKITRHSTTPSSPLRKGIFTSSAPELL